MKTTWEAVLDDLERQVARAGQLIASSAVEDLPDWEPPAHLGPLPRHLVARAQDLVERQQAVIERIPALLHATRQQHQVGSRIAEATTRHAAPVYVDVTA